jgi:hypothetical protein
VILSARSFVDTSAAFPDGDGNGLGRPRQPQEWATFIAEATRNGVGAVAPVNDAAIVRALQLAHATSPLEVYPVIPNVLGYVRDAADHGLVGAGIKHARNVRIADLLGIGVRGLARIRGVLARDFTAVLPLLIEVEMAAFRAFRPPLVFLHSQVTDLALAFGNREVLRIFADVVRRRFDAVPGVSTNNYALLVQRAAEWELPLPVVAAPFNPQGFLMKPTRPACEALVARAEHQLIADRIALDPASLAASFAYLHSLGIPSALVDAHEIDTVRQAVESARDANQSGTGAAVAHAT